jgi:cation/acetate symporter
MATTEPWLRGLFGVSKPVELWFGIQPISAGVFGVPVGFAVIVIVSLLTAAPSRAAQELVDDLRHPSRAPDG